MPDDGQNWRIVCPCVRPDDRVHDPQPAGRSGYIPFRSFSWVACCGRQATARKRERPPDVFTISNNSHRRRGPIYRSVFLDRNALRTDIDRVQGMTSGGCSADGIEKPPGQGTRGFEGGTWLSVQAETVSPRGFAEDGTGGRVELASGAPRASSRQDSASGSSRPITSRAACGSFRRFTSDSLRSMKT